MFAFVGSWSLDDYCGAQVLAQHPVPAIQQSLSVDFQKLPGSYSIDPYNAGAITGYFEYFKAKYPDAIGSVGTIVGNQPAAVQSWKYFKATMESLGYKVQYEDDFPPAQTNFTADVVRMKSQGIKMVFIIAVNAPDLAIFSQESYQQGFKPEVFAAPIGYFGSYISEAGGPQVVEGQWIPVVQAQFLGEDAPNVPEIALFDQWMKKDFSSFPIDQRRPVRRSPQTRRTTGDARQVARCPRPDPQLQRQRHLPRHRRRVEEKQHLLHAAADQGWQVRQGRHPAQGFPL